MAEDMEKTMPFIMKALIIAIMAIIVVILAAGISYFVASKAVGNAKNGAVAEKEEGKHSDNKVLRPADLSNHWLEFWFVAVFNIELSHVPQVLRRKNRQPREVMLRVSGKPYALPSDEHAVTAKLQDFFYLTFDIHRTLLDQRGGYDRCLRRSQSTSVKLINISSTGNAAVIRFLH